MIYFISLLLNNTNQNGHTFFVANRHQWDHKDRNRLIRKRFPKGWR